jgi:hypothetical protein
MASFAEQMVFESSKQVILRVKFNKYTTYQNKFQHFCQFAIAVKENSTENSGLQEVYVASH